MPVQPPLYGLVLAGGLSRRMQRDKAALEFGGKPALARAVELAGTVCEQVFVSVRPDQLADPLRSRFPAIADLHEGVGPIAGIAAAQAAHPQAAWLVVACDLPLLTRETLEHLLRSRNPGKVATAFRSAHDGLPEPLCAIWEPSTREAVTAWIAAGKQCPRKLLINSGIELIEQPDPQALDNVNTPAELAAASVRLETGDGTPVPGQDPGTSSDHSARAPAASPQAPASPKTLRVQYFALFREQAGRSEETVESMADTPARLYAELQHRHPFRLQKEQLRVAVNAEFRDWQSPLRNGDTVVFIPPVAGG